MAASSSSSSSSPVGPRGLTGTTDMKELPNLRTICNLSRERNAIKEGKQRIEYVPVFKNDPSARGWLLSVLEAMFDTSTGHINLSYPTFIGGTERQLIKQVPIGTFMSSYVENIPFIWDFFYNLHLMGDVPEILLQRGEYFKIPMDVGTNITISKKAWDTYFHFIETGDLLEVTTQCLCRSTHIAEQLADYWYLDQVYDSLDLSTISLEDIACLAPSMVDTIVNDYLNHCFVKLPPVVKTQIYIVETNVERRVETDRYGWWTARTVTRTKRTLVSDNNPFIIAFAIWCGAHVVSKKVVKHPKYPFEDALNNFVTIHPSLAAWIWRDFPKGKLIDFIEPPIRKATGLKKAETFDDLVKYFQRICPKADPFYQEMMKDPTVARLQAQYDECCALKKEKESAIRMGRRGIYISPEENEQIDGLYKQLNDAIRAFQSKYDRKKLKEAKMATFY